MPWRLRKMLMLIVIGAAALALSIIVMVQDANLSTELLAIIGVLGGLAIVVNELPANGNGKPG